MAAYMKKRTESMPKCKRGDDRDHALAVLLMMTNCFCSFVEFNSNDDIFRHLVLSSDKVSPPLHSEQYG